MGLRLTSPKFWDQRPEDVTHLMADAKDAVMLTGWKQNVLGLRSKAHKGCQQRIMVSLTIIITATYIYLVLSMGKRSR